jgi:hypothetical protein
VDRVVGGMLGIVGRCTGLEVDGHQRGVRRTDLGVHMATGAAASDVDATHNLILAPGCHIFIVLPRHTHAHNQRERRKGRARSCRCRGGVLP